MARSSGIARSSSEILDAICSKSGMHLLKVFLYKPGLEAHQADIVSSSGLSRVTATRLLNTFEKSGILHVSKKGDLKLYSIANGNPIIKQLKIFINVTDITMHIKSLSRKDVEVYLYGSVARGEDNEGSDIDLLIITGQDKEIIFKALGKLRYNLNRDVNPIIYAPMEFSKLPVTDKAFFEAFEKDKIRLI